MEQIKISAKYKAFNDINDIDPEFIEIILNEMKAFIGFTVKILAKSEKSFNDEPLVALKALIEYKKKEFSISIERTTYNNTFLINITICSDNDKELFTYLYDLKVEIIKFLKDHFGEVYYIHDTSNEKICTDLYKRVHSIENYFRQVITDFYIRKLGCYDLSKNLESNVIEYSGWYNSKYKDSPFRNIESPLFNLMTDKLFDVLKRPLFDLDSEERKRLIDSVDKLNEVLDDLFWTSEFTINTMKLNDFRKKFSRDFDKYKGKTIYELYFKDTLQDDFEAMWKEFSKMRNMVAHNKPICKELYNDILKACTEIGGRLEKAKDKVDSMFIPDEVLIADALYEEQQDQLQAEADEIEYQREMSGIDPVWSEDTVVEMLSYKKEIESLLSIINEYKIVKKLMEDYNEVYYRIDERVDGLDIINANQFKQKIEAEFETRIEVDTDLDEEDTLSDTKAGIIDALNEHILDLENIYNEIDDSEILDYFTVDEPLANFKDLYGNEYSVYINGTLNPDHNHEECIEVHLKKNAEVIKKGYINIDYGGFDSYDYFENNAENPSEANITLILDEFNKEVEAIIGDSIVSMETKIQALKKVDSFIENNDTI
ncbi:hypothetical protein JMF89_13245 [Clostridiaceae bacterium UIB06]|nr:hypothetical protein [Clostridiaceae bacterium UIB06]